MLPLSTAELIRSIPHEPGSLGGQLVRDMETVILPVKFLVFDDEREEPGASLTQPAAYFFTAKIHLIALSKGVISGENLSIIAHEIGHARLVEEGYPLFDVAPGLTREEVLYYRHLAWLLPTAFQDPVINSRLFGQGYPIEKTYVEALGSVERTVGPENEANRMLHALSVYLHLQVLTGSPTLREYWNTCIADDPGLAGIVTGILPSASPGMTPEATRGAIARFRVRYDLDCKLVEVVRPVSA